MAETFSNKIVVMTTCESAAEAEKIARHLVENGLAACVNIVPGLTSVYRWKDAVESAMELLLVIKTSRELFEEVRAAIEKLHSYELPECIALPLAAGSERYLAWLERGLKQDDASPR